MLTPPPPDVAVFAALADPTRLSLLQRLRDQRPRSTTQLVQGTGLTRQAVRKHLGVLSQAGLVRHRRSGRTRQWELDARPLEQVSVWADSYRRFWETRLDQLDALLLAQLSDD
ncbi:MAG: helix-turn-helix transcriptional regulator [Alphaproteobacteria bacterium]|nr:helix-turn-helix transcriptional regulator [Alphaproteobacteria bacterium]MCB9793598.1 helix-turn-helix transcriptional regulator [Alphaproteobacteria bacterium]